MHSSMTESENLPGCRRSSGKGWSFEGSGQGRSLCMMLRCKFGIGDLGYRAAGFLQPCCCKWIPNELGGLQVCWRRPNCNSPCALQQLTQYERRPCRSQTSRPKLPRDMPRVLCKVRPRYLQTAIICRSLPVEVVKGQLNENIQAQQHNFCHLCALVDAFSELSTNAASPTSECRELPNSSDTQDSSTFARYTANCNYQRNPQQLTSESPTADSL